MASLPGFEGQEPDRFDFEFGPNDARTSTVVAGERRGENLSSVAVTSPRMNSSSATPLDLSEFCAASAETIASVPNGDDILTRIQEWVAAAVPAIATARAALLEVDAGGAKVFGPRWRFADNFSKRVDEDAPEWELLRLAHRGVADFIEAHGLESEDVPAFVRTALGRDGGSPRDVLSAWDAERIRSHFLATYGDVREAAINQIRDRVMGDLEDVRPAAVLTIWAHLFERCSRGMGRTYNSGREGRIERFLRYVVHLGTGESPADIQLPTIIGVNDGSSQWERSQLFRRQKSPAPGILWLRHTADGNMEIALEPNVLARMQAQWDARFGGGKQ